MPLATSRQLLDLLRQERILGAASLEEAERLAAQMPEPRALANHLIQRGLLTPFQADHLLQGKAADLFLKDYVLLGPLGEGGMGTVFRARHKVMRRDVAIKVLRPEFTQNAEVVRRFRREVEIAATLSHPNVVHAYDAGEDGGRHYLVMELIEGVDLQELVRQRGPLPIAQACDLIRQAALGLQYAHERGLVHRDVKPSNLLVTTRAGSDGNPPGVVKILDLGLARLALLVEQQTAVTFRTRAGSFLGTPDFLAPEQALDPTKADIRSDIYGLGCTLHFFLTGKPPFPEEGSMTQKLLWHQQQEPPSAAALRPDVPPPLADYVRRMLAKQPRHRPQTPAEVAQALTAWAGVAARPTPSVMAGPSPTAAKEGSWSLSPPADPEPMPVAVYPTYDRPAYPAYEHPASAASEARAPGRSSAWPYLLVPLLILLLTGGIILAIHFWPPGDPANPETKITEDKVKKSPEIVSTDGPKKELPKKEEPKKEPPKDEGPAKVITNALKMKLVWIEPGRFQMGSPLGEMGRGDDEFQHDVEITQGFYLGAFEVTQDEYRQVMGGNPSSFNAGKVGKNTDDFPVETVSWDDAMEFCRRLTAKEKETGRVYDLPTEAEWEYAARAGTRSVFAFGDALDSNQANFNGDYPYGGAAKGPYLKRTTSVGAYKANAWGLCDMHGNVWEWCKDWYGPDYYRDSGLKDPPGPKDGTGRVLRGGSWGYLARNCRSAQRNYYTPDLRHLIIGLRVAVRLSPRTP